MKNTKRAFGLSNLLLIACLSLSFNILTPLQVQADSLWEKQVGMGTEDDQVGGAFGETVDDRNKVSDVRIVIAKIIRIFLGFMGIIFLILVIYGGVLWMTAAGNDENIKKAKSLLVAGIIGLIIIMSSFAVAKLITDKIYSATLRTTAP